MKISDELLLGYALGRDDFSASFALRRILEGRPINGPDQDTVDALRYELEELLQKRR